MKAVVAAVMAVVVAAGTEDRVLSVRSGSVIQRAADDSLLKEHLVNRLGHKKLESAAGRRRMSITGGCAASSTMKLTVDKKLHLAHWSDPLGHCCAGSQRLY